MSPNRDSIFDFLQCILLYITATIITVECREGPPKTNNTYDSVRYGVLCYVPSVSLIMYLQSLLWGLFLVVVELICEKIGNTFEKVCILN